MATDIPTLLAGPYRPPACRRGVWTLGPDGLAFTPVTLGRADLDGQVQVLQGLAAGDQVVVYSEGALTARSRTRVVERISGVTP